MADKSKPRILNVDDNDAGRYATSRILRQAGFEVLEAATGEEALRRVEERPDLVVLDVKLPDIHGFEVCRQIKANPRTAGIPVVHLSATYVNSAHRVTGLEGGVDGYLTQPVEPQELVATIKAFLRLKAAEQGLRETNEYLDSLFHLANAPIIVWDPQFRITRFNRAFESLAGRQAADVLGRSLEILFPPDRVNDSMKLIQKTLSGERWESVEIPILHRDGSVRTLLWNSATLFTPDGTAPVATIAQGHDITERKRAEQQLSRERELMNALMEHTPDHVYFKDAESRFVRVSRAMAKWLGLDEPAQAIGKTDFDFFDLEHAEPA